MFLIHGLLILEIKIMILEEVMELGKIFISEIQILQQQQQAIYI